MAKASYVPRLSRTCPTTRSRSGRGSSRRRRSGPRAIHDTQYSAAEYPQRVGWGHSALPQVLRFAGLAGVKRLVTFHHDPGHDDATLDRLVREARRTGPPFDVIPGTEGATFEL